MNRREFAKSTAAILGGAVAASFPASASAFYAGADTIRVGLIGAGGRGKGAAVQALKAHPAVKLVAIADAFEDRVEQAYTDILNAEADLKPRIDVPKERRFAGFDGYRQVIPLVDVVILATPPGFRPIHFEAAIDAGKHVFMEKPVATDAPGVRKVLETAEKAKAKKLNVVVGLQRHYQTIYKDWIGRLHDGAIGDIILSKVYWNNPGVWTRPRQPEWTEMEYQMRNWYYFNWLCGDHIVEQHIHNIDVSNWAKTAHPVRAQGQGGRQVRTGLDTGEIFDHHMVEFEYADGSTMMSQCRHIPGADRRVTEGFWGSKGSAPKPGVILDARGNVILEASDAGHPNPYQVEHDELFDAVSKGEYRFADSEMGAIATMTAIMGRMATYSGQVIEWDKALQSNINLMPERFAWDANPKVLPDKNGLYPIAVPGETITV